MMNATMQSDTTQDDPVERRLRAANSIFEQACRSGDPAAIKDAVRICQAVGRGAGVTRKLKAIREVILDQFRAMYPKKGGDA